MAKSADATDLKSVFRQRECGFKSRPGHQENKALMWATGHPTEVAFLVIVTVIVTVSRNESIYPEFRPNQAGEYGAALESQDRVVELSPDELRWRVAEFELIAACHRQCGFLGMAIGIPN